MGCRRQLGMKTCRTDMDEEWVDLYFSPLHLKVLEGKCHELRLRAHTLLKLSRFVGLVMKWGTFRTPGFAEQ